MNATNFRLPFDQFGKGFLTDTVRESVGSQTLTPAPGRSKQA